MKTLISVFALTLFFTANAHADCHRVLNGTTMTIFGHENLYDIECDGHTEAREVVGPDKANELVDKYSGINEHDKARDQRNSEALHQANEAARQDQEQAYKEGWNQKEEDQPISN